MSFDPSDLITSDDELKAVFAGYAGRRVRFTEAWLGRSVLGDILRAVEAEAGTVDWSEAGIEQRDVRNLVERGFKQEQIHLVFAHPNMIADDPSRLVYYQRLLSMSGKVFPRLFPHLAPLRRASGLTQLGELVQAELIELNGMLAQVAARSGFLPEEPVRLAVASEGAAIDGDWRNQTGRIATWRTLEAMLTAVPQHQLVRVEASKAGEARNITRSGPDTREDLMDEGWKPSELDIRTGYRVRFGPQNVSGTLVDADVTIARLDERGEPNAVVTAGEVKGTTDPANAKERWRLASGNIEAMNRIRSGRASVRPTTFYMGLVMTAAVVDGDSNITGMRELLSRRSLDFAFSLVKLTETPELRRFQHFFRSQTQL